MANAFDQFDVSAKAGNPFDQFDVAQKEVAARKERTMLEAAKDIGAGAVSGAGALVQLPGQLYGLATGDFSDTGLTKVGRELRETGESMKSEELKRQETERAAKIGEAAKEGQFKAGVTAFMETIKNPALLTNFIAEQAPNLLPGLAVARGLAKAGMTAGAVRGAVGAGAVQQGADVGAETFKRMHEELVSKGVSPEEATGQVLGYARWVGLGAGALSGVVNILPGGRAIEEAMAKVPIKGGKLTSMVKGGASEAAAEMVEEGGGKVAQNLAMKQIKPEQSLTEGLGETMGMAAVGGLGLGTAAGLSRRGEVATLPAEEAPAVERPTQTAAAPLAPAATSPEAKRLEQIRIEDELRARAEAPPVPDAEFVERPPAPLSEEEEKRIAAMEEDKIAFEKEANKLEKYPERGSSLWSAMQGNLTPSDYAELGDKSFAGLKAPRGMGKSISELAADGSLNLWLPPELQMTRGQQDDFIGTEGDELTKAKAADEYIKERLRERNYLTWATNNRLQEIGTSLSQIESSFREIADEETLNTLAQEAANEQRAIDAETTTAPTEGEVGGLEPPARVLEAISEEPVAEEYFPDQDVLKEEVGALPLEERRAEAAQLAPEEGFVGIEEPAAAPAEEQEYFPDQAELRGSAKFMRAEPSDVGSTVAQIQSVVNQITPTWSNAPEIKVVDSIDNLPPEIRDQAIRDGVDPRGVFDPKTEQVFLVANRIRNKADAAITLAHEALGHYGLRVVLGKNFKPMMADVYAKNKSVKTRADTYIKDGLDKTTAVEEVLAEMAQEVYDTNVPENKVKLSALQKVMNAVRQFLRKLGVPINTITDAEVLSLIANARQSVIKGTGKPVITEKGRAVYSVREKVSAAKETAQKALQKRKLPKSQFEGVSDDLYNDLQPIFAPERKTVIDKIDGMRDGFWRKLAQGIADQYRTIKDIDEDAYMKARMSKSVDGALEGILFNGEVKLTDGALDIAKDTKGLLSALEPVGQEVDRYQIWVALNRDAQLVSQGKAPSISKDVVARRSELSKGMIGNKSRLEVYQEVQKDMNKLNQSVLKIAYDQGIIDKEAYKIFARDINYIPFYKVMEDDGDVQAAATKSGLVNQYFSKALKGGEKPFGDLMENTLRNWSHILSSAMKNEAANATVRATMDLGGAFPNLKVGLEWRTDEDGKNGKVYSSRNGQLVGNLKPEYTTSGKGMIKTMIDGKPAYFDIKDPMLLESIMSIGYMGPKSKFLDVAKDFKNMLQFGVTLSPAFKIRNLFRDSISAIAVTDLKRNPFANIIQGWVASDKNNPAHISALAGGAIFNFGSAYEGDQSKLIKRLLDSGVKGDNILDSDKKIRAGLGKAWRAYQEWGNKSESANRIALYNQLKETINPKTKEKYTHLEASFYARDMLDFSMQGSWPAFRLVTQVVPFLNARVQGLYKLGRDGIIPTSRVIYNTITGKEITATEKQRAEQFSVVMTAVALASLMLYMAYKDDEEFKKREQWDRDNFWWFKLPGMEAAIRVPKPFEIGAIGTMSERVLEQIIDQGVEGKVFGQSMSRMLTDTFAINPTPQMIKPLIDLYSNKDSFTGAPIETAGMERLSKAERIAEKTSPLAIGLSKVSNVFLPESTEVSPVQVDYAIKAYFGWLGGTVSSSSHYAMMPFSKSAYPDANWTETMSMGFIKTLPATQSKYVTAFYENNKEISQAYADMRHFAQLGQADKVQEILEEKGDKIAMAKFYDNASKDMAKMRQAIQAIRNDANMSGAQKTEEIDRMKVIIGQLAQQMEEARVNIKKQYAASQ